MKLGWFLQQCVIKVFTVCIQTRWVESNLSERLICPLSIQIRMTNLSGGASIMTSLCSGAVNYLSAFRVVFIARLDLFGSMVWFRRNRRLNLSQKCWTLLNQKACMIIFAINWFYFLEVALLWLIPRLLRFSICGLFLSLDTLYRYRLVNVRFFPINTRFDFSLPPPNKRSMF